MDIDEIGKVFILLTIIGPIGLVILASCAFATISIVREILGK